ncbi:MAG TPA: HD-GYP domain-containing protein [Bacillota bacterium]|nr:HD-GYP domain-containing protein [Bacillota bacterium]
MRIVPIEAVQPGMRLAQPVYRYDDGKILLQANVELKPMYIRRLRELRYSYLYILEPGENVGELVNLELIKQETKAKAGLVVSETVRDFQKARQNHLHKIKQVVREMVDQIFGHTDVVYNMLDIRSYDNYTYAHSVNVCTIALIIGSAMGMSRCDLEYLGIGALLHDIGKIFVDAEILNKPGSLKPEEYDRVKNHTWDGYELLKEKIGMNYISSHVAFQHHEREDGSGYPRGITGDQIHRFAKIVAVADVYDAMTSYRVYKNAMPSHVVLNKIKAEADRKFNSTVVQCLEKMVAPYPIGSLLLLSNGEQVIVDRVTQSACWVRVTSGERVGLIFDLYRQQGLDVVENIC